MELVPFLQFSNQLESICQSRAVELIKTIEALNYVKIDRGLFGYEKHVLKCAKEQLLINENILKFIDPKYSLVQ